MTLRLRSGVLVGLSLAVVTLASQPDLAQRRSRASRKQDADRCQGKLGRIHELCHAAEGEGAGQGIAADLADDAAHRRRAELLPALPPQGPGAGGRRRSDARRARRGTRARHGHHRPRCGPQAEAARVDRSDELHDRPAALDGRQGCSSRRTASAASSSSPRRSPASRFPKSLLQELLSYYSKSAEKPSGISMDDPFELPARIKEIRVGKGEAMVVQ